MMRGPRNLLWLVPLVMVGLAPLWWHAVGDFLSPHSDLVGSQGEAEQRLQVFVMDDVLLKQHNNGVEEWNIRSNHLSSSDSGETLLFDGVIADLFRDGAVLFHIVRKNSGWVWPVMSGSSIKRARFCIPSSSISWIRLPES